MIQYHDLKIIINNKYNKLRDDFEVVQLGIRLQYTLFNFGIVILLILGLLLRHLRKSSFYNTVVAGGTK